jgi:hypothetical protein
LCGVLEEELAQRRVCDLWLLNADTMQRAVTQFLAGGVSTSTAGMWFLLQLLDWGGR